MARKVICCLNYNLFSITQSSGDCFLLAQLQMSEFFLRYLYTSWISNFVLDLY